MNITKICRYIALLLSLLLLGGCTLFEFEPMEEVQQKEEDKTQLAVQSAEVEPETMVTDALVFERTMATDSGVVLASYEAHLPQFAEDGAKSGVFQNINEFYQQEFEAFSADCDWIFLTLQEELGAGWNNITDERQPVTAEFGYEMFTLGEQYLSIVRDYTYTDTAGRQSVYYFAEVFDLATGWRLSFDTLFGDNTADAKTAVIEGLAGWCEENSLAFDTRETISADAVVEEFAMTDDEIIFCLEPFALSADDAQGRLVRLPLSGFEQWLP